MGEWVLRLVHPGSIVHITDTTGVVIVTQMQPISVIFSLPQDQLPDILAGVAHGKLPVVAYTRDGSKSLAEGVLSVVDSQVDSTTGHAGRFLQYRPHPLAGLPGIGQNPRTYGSWSHRCAEQGSHARPGGRVRIPRQG